MIMKDTGGNYVEEGRDHFNAQ